MNSHVSEPGESRQAYALGYDRAARSPHAMTMEHVGWSDSAERRWIWWTAVVCIAWSLWYLAVPRLTSLRRLAELIGEGVAR